MHRDCTVEEVRLTSTLSNCITDPNPFFWQNLLFSARTRLPANMSFQQQREIVDDVINLLGLNELRHCPIGNEGTLFFHLYILSQ